MKRILVIADDLTGAAEIGGIAVRHGLTATIHHGQFLDAETDAIIVDTNSRHLAASEAAEKIGSFLKSVDASIFDLIYKKTDSMLRGPVATELFAAISSLDFDRALLVPQNPSRSRVIKNGEYFIDDIPLHQSPVGIDVKHPPATANVLQIADPTGKLDIHCHPPGQSAPASGITIGCAANASEIAWWVTQRTPKTLLAGSADFFTAALQSLNLATTIPTPFSPRIHNSIFVFGSASAPSRNYLDILATAGAIICDIDHPNCAARIVAEYQSTGRAFIAARSTVSSDRAEHIRQTMTDMIAQILPQTSPNTLYIEGGSTASAIIQRQGWTALYVKSQLAPGIVAIQPETQPSPLLVLKPGTYPWPADFFEFKNRTADKRG